jgi:hypothetical protein
MIGHTVDVPVKRWGSVFRAREQLVLEAPFHRKRRGTGDLAVYDKFIASFILL